MSPERSQLVTTGLLSILVGVVAAKEPPSAPLIAIEGYGHAPMEFTIGEQASMTIHYREDIDPERIHVRLNGRAMPRMLNAESGGRETVPLYLENGENRLVIEASSTDHPRDEGPERRFEYRFIETLNPLYGSGSGSPADGDYF